MRKYSFKYLTQRSLHSLVRNGFMTVASVLTLSLCLLVTGCFGLLVYNIYVNLNELDGLNEIVCMCDYDLEDGREKEIEAAIKNLNNVESITFISKEEAFKEQIKQYAAFPQILEYFEKTNSSGNDDVKDTTASAGPESPDEDSSENGINGKKIVADAVAKRDNYKSYTYKSIVIMKMFDEEIRIDGIEKLISDDDSVQFLMESFVGEQIADAKYYKDGVLYVNGETPCCGELAADKFYSSDCIELRKMDWIADFSSYNALETNGGYTVTTDGNMPESVIKAFDLSSVIPMDETPEVSGYATVVVDENGNIVSESFNMDITVSADGTPLELKITYNSEITDIDSLENITFDDEALSEYEQTDDILSVISADTSDDEVPSDTDTVTDSHTGEAVTENVTDDVTTPVTDTEADKSTVRDQNPLSDAFKVVYKDINGITELRDRLSAIDGIRSVKDAADAAQTLQNLKDTVMIIFVGFMIALIFVSLVIIGFTISMAISTREKEVLVMRYVGATSFFISFPFLLESIFIGLISTAVAYGLQYGLYGYLCSMLVNSGQEVASFISIAPFSEIWLPTLLGYLFIAILTCYVGCKITLSRKVKV